MKTENDWIMTAQRLPEHGMHVWYYTNDGRMYIGRFTTVGIFKMRDCFWPIGRKFPEHVKNVVAWMPLDIPPIPNPAKINQP